MSYSILKSEVITYPPETLNTFHVTAYDYIDNLHFLMAPQEFLENTEAYVTIAKKQFLKEGWEGDGEIKLMWIPPFMLKQEFQLSNTRGITIWHVKQLNDGISWLLHPADFFNKIKF